MLHNLVVISVGRYTAPSSAPPAVTSPPRSSAARPPTSATSAASRQPPGGSPGLLVTSERDRVVPDRGRGRAVIVILGHAAVLRLVAGQGVPLGGDLVVQTPEVLGGGAVEVEPPVADEVVLVEESTVGTEEAVLGQTSGSVSSADVESLALSLGVSVVTWKYFD